jgi:RHS repeat-associated protein
VSESFIVQQIDYYPYGMVAREFRRLGDKATNDLFQEDRACRNSPVDCFSEGARMQGRFEDLTRWYDFHARQYDAAVGRWFGVDAMASKMPGMSPYNAMANNPIMFTDPDGNEPITIAFAIGLILKGAAIGGGLMGAAYTVSAAMLPGGLSRNFQWSQFGRSVGTGALLGAISGGAKVVGKVGLKTLANSFGGVINTLNNYDPAKGLGWHSLGHFAAGYIGTAVGISETSFEGFVAGGILNAFVGFGTRKDINLYGVAQDLVAGGLASVAGKSLYKSGLPPDENQILKTVFGDKLIDKTVSYGLQNVGSNFAFDKSQSYFNDRADLKIAGSFLIGSFGGLAQSGIMKERTGSRGGAGTFGKLFGLSTFAYLGEYAANYLWNSSSRPPSLSFSGYYGYKQASFGIKSMFYTYLNW